MSIRGSVLRVEMLKGSKGATGLENEPCMLIFEGGDGGGVEKEKSPSKTCWNLVMLRHKRDTRASVMELMRRCSIW